MKSRYFIMILVCCTLMAGLSDVFYLYAKSAKRPVFSAFVRIKNEIKTIEASLNSIKGVFDKIVIIHSNEPDDGTNALAEKWCVGVDGCEIHEYPHAVIPSHNKAYRKKVTWENTLAAYYNFGLTFFSPEEWVVKIDADQVYITSQLKETINILREKSKENSRIAYGIKGCNTFPYRGRLVKWKSGPYNGGMDSFIVQRKYMNDFKQSSWYEVTSLSPLIQKKIVIYKTHWFHYMKTLKANGMTVQNDTVDENRVLPLTKSEIEIYEKNVLPLLEASGSPYRELKFK